MADNVTVDNGGLTDYTAATDKVTYSGDANVDVQLVRIVETTGSEGSKTVVPLTTGQQYVEDTAITADAGQGTLVVARRDNALSTLTPAENDAVGLRVNGNGALWTAQDPTVQVSVSVDDSTTALLANVAGDVPHDSPDSGGAGPVKVGGKAVTSIPAAVANNDRVDAQFDERGAQAVVLTARGGAGDPSVLSFGFGDGITPGNVAGLSANSLGLIYNGSTIDRIKSVEGVSAAPNTDVGVQAVGIGPGYDRKTNPTGVAATSTSNAVEVLVNGADMVAFHVTTIGTTPGSMIFQTSGDDAAWATAGMVIKQSTGPDLRIEGSFVPAVDDVYLVRTTGVRRVRYKVNAVYASGTATVKVTASAGAGMVKAQDMVGAPHNIGYAPTSAGAQYSSAQTSATIGPTVSSTQRMCVTSLQIQCGGTVAATQVSIYFGTSTFTRGTSRTIFDGEFAPSATSKPGFAIAPVVPFMGAADEELKITSVGAANPLTVTYWYYLIAA